MSRPAKGAEIEFTVDAFADRGKGLARLPAPDDAPERAGGYVVFVPGGTPGDRVRARVVQRRKAYAETRLLEVVAPGPHRVVPRCRYAGHDQGLHSDGGPCGGCKWQHVGYEAQLAMKRQQVHDALTRGGGLDLDGVEVAPTLGADRDEGSGGRFFYRNKMEFSFAASRWLTDDEIASGEPLTRDFALGLHAPGRFDRVLDLHECHLQSAWSARLVNGMRELALANGWAPWDTRHHTGFLRHLVIRQAAHTDDRMVNLVTNGHDPARMETVAAWLRADFPETTTFVNTVHTGLGPTGLGADAHVVFGPGVIRDRMGRHTFEIAPEAFFQTNTRQAERLYEVAAAMADLRETDLVYDLYCGAGTISLFVADRVRHVVGVELVEAAVENARANAVANGVPNTTFAAGDMLRLFTPDFVAAHGTPDVLIVDPPRAGMHPKVVDQIAALAPERLVYVSCNPRTQADDLARLVAAVPDYWITGVQPVDLFPHTHHVEAVVGLRRG